MDRATQRLEELQPNRPQTKRLGSWAKRKRGVLR